jgi:hypothetical protein
MAEAMDVLADALDITETDVADDDAAAGQAQADFPAAAMGVTEFVGAPPAEFAHLDPQKAVPADLLGKALDFFHTHRDKFTNQKVISVLDYGRNSRDPRFHVIDMVTGQVHSLRMANGIGSEPVHNGQATKFGNVPGSNMSSLGFVRTAETYQGKHGLSLRLDGLSDTNSNMRKRAVVVHGASYVTDKPVIQGRSNGCPAVPMSQFTGLINAIKGGSLMLFGIAGQG